MAISSVPKIGLCLSGGGFRASLFHIGTLAALAEAKKLHQVEILSTVSGGSVIGAYYYLKLKQLFEGNRPGVETITTDDYVNIVKEIEVDFLEAVQQNPRLRLLLNPFDTAKIVLDERYSRSDRLAEILDDLFFRPITRQSILLHEINIVPPPKGNQQVFTLASYNSESEFKIPTLILNSTSLNTGHAWHFTGSWMGEPRRDLANYEQDSNVLLPQLRFDGYYQDDINLPFEERRTVSNVQLNKMRSLSLAKAVVASAAVPGLLTPLPVHDLYRNKRNEEIVLQLADGGVFDNQGLDALYWSGCTQTILSDACGQLVDEALLKSDVLSVVMRTNNVMSERIRGWNYLNLRSPQRNAKDGPFMHLRQESFNYNHLPKLPGPVNKSDGLVYRLSGLRTDFDSFSNVEAYALMYHAYCLTRDQYLMRSAPIVDWKFLSTREKLQTPRGTSQLHHHLTIGGMHFLRLLKLKPLGFLFVTSLLMLPFLIILMLLICKFNLIALASSFNLHSNLPTCTYAELATAIGLFVAFAIILLPSVRGYLETSVWTEQVVKNPIYKALRLFLYILVAVLAITVSFYTWIQLLIYNNLFLKAGSD